MTKMVYKKKISFLCVCPCYYPAFEHGGPIYSMHNLDKGLINNGVDVEVYTTNQFLSNKVKVNNKTIIDGVTVTYFDYNRAFDFFTSNGWHFSWSLISALKKNIPRFDIVHLPTIWNFTTVIAAYFCRKYNKPYIISPHGQLYPYTFNHKGWKKWIYYHLISRYDLKMAKAIRYTSRDEAIKVDKFLNLKTNSFILPNGLDLSEFENLPKKEELVKQYPFLKGKKVILFLGRICSKKGLNILIDSFNRLSGEMDNLHLLIVGPDFEN